MAIEIYILEFNRVTIYTKSQKKASADENLSDENIWGPSIHPTLNFILHLRQSFVDHTP